MYTTMIGCYCQVCDKPTIQQYQQSIERISNTEYKVSNEDTTLICEECHSIECTVERFLELTRE